MKYYRTRTYIAGDWDNDIDAVEQLHKWNDSDYWSLSFTDAHDLMSANDSSLNCSIKASLQKRMDASKCFVLIVGDHTKTTTAGSCRWCDSYNSHTYHCAKNYLVDYRSFIKYECEKAVKNKNEIKIIVLYNSTRVDKSKCIEDVQHLGKHVAMKYKDMNGNIHWDYNAVKEAFEE